MIQWNKVEDGLPKEPNVNHNYLVLLDNGKVAAVGLAWMDCFGKANGVTHWASCNLPETEKEDEAITDMYSQASLRRIESPLRDLLQKHKKPVVSLNVEGVLGSLAEDRKRIKELEARCDLLERAK